MKRGAESSALMAGFTIVETMIVLAVTGLLFVAIATTWFGRQHKTEFQTSAQDIRSRIQQVISDVQNGYFPGQGSYSCQITPAGLLLSGNSAAQGTNYPCVFLGKIIQFHFKDTSPEAYRVYSVAADGSKTSLQTATARVIAPSNTPAPATGVGMKDLSDRGVLNNGLTLQAYKIGSGGKVLISNSADLAIGFLSSLGTVNNGAYVSGTQQISTYAFTESSQPTDSGSDAPDAINGILKTFPASFTSSINKPLVLCFQSGGTNQFAAITIGGNSSRLTADLQIKQGTCNADFS